MTHTEQVPVRLHHNAYVTKDLEATRHFYEDIIGLPLVAAWAESDELFGAVRTFCHCFFGMADGGALAFFQFADPDDQARFGPDLPMSPFRHIALKVDQATQDGIAARLQAAGHKEPEFFVLEHGYCRSIYASDPNGLLLEFTLDAPNADQIDRERRIDAHDVLRRWLAGDHTSNNIYR